MTKEGDHPLLVSPPRKQRRPGPANPRYGIPRAQWPDVIRRAEQSEPLRQIAKDYDVSYQTIWRILHHPTTRQQEGGEDG